MYYARPMRSLLASCVALLVLASAPIGRAQANREDPLELRLNESGLSDRELTATSAAPLVDVELRIVSEGRPRGLRATRQLEGGGGVERRLCVSPCTTYLERGAYRFAVETRHGRGRDAPGVYSLNFDGTLTIGMHSRRAMRALWWSATAALVGGGLALFFTHNERQFKDDPFCVANCTYYTTGQRAAMTAGGVMFMFGGIAMRYGISTRDSGIVHYDPSPRSRHIDPDEAP